jgi:hypothetical protein
VAFALLATPSLGAATLDVSADTSVVVHTGDSLVFRLLASNFGVSATQFGLPQAPSQLNFVLVTETEAGSGSFAVTLESADRTVLMGPGELTFHSGYFQGNTFSGEVSMLEGFLPLLPDTALDAAGVVLALRNEGPDVRLGLIPYLVRQNLYVGLSGGLLSVGAVPYLVDLESREWGRSTNLTNVAISASMMDIPEPGSGGLLLGGGVLLWAVTTIETRMSRRGSIRR